ncbi:SRPBCC family protein [Inquilinus sp.]|jgi:uncharacterized protein YndB with AHSA1/START domain|uniref:SRPBCC family protein n=1 Tax=Inquilinus sp. TaxID=1932117 RepID=UPI003783FB0E
MAGSTFVYVTFIRTTPVALWQALTDTEVTPRYWLGVHHEAEWRAGGAWKLILPDGRVGDAGEVLEFNPPRRLALRWRNEFRPELKEEGWSRCTMDIEPAGEAVKLTVTHSIEQEGSKLIEAVSGGWPLILSNLKSLLETGSVVLESRPG